MIGTVPTGNCNNIIGLKMGKSLFAYFDINNRPPMPSEAELERRFNEVLIQMDLPPERAKILKGFTNEKKWDTVCDHDLVHAKAG
jgi:hypothetical protein